MTVKHLLGCALLVLVGCSDDETAIAPSAQSGAQTTKPSTSVTPQAAAPECPADVAAPKQLVKDRNASAVQLVGSSVFYMTNGALMKVGVDGTGPVTVFESSALVHAYVQGESLLTVENGGADTPEAVLRLIPLAEAPTATPATDDSGATGGALLTPPATWNAAGTRIFAADDRGFFLVGDEENGQGIYHLGAEDLTFATLVATDTAVVTNLQVTSDALWYVRDNAHVFRVDRAVTAVDVPLVPVAPKEAFAVDAAGCGLVVAGSRALCVQASAIQARDLDGKNPAPLFDLARSRVKAGFSVGVNGGDAVVVAASSAIRAVTIANASEKVISCGRDGINSVDASPTNVVWTESGKDAGVWIAPR